LLSHVLNGLSFGSLLFLVASGLTLSFGLLRTLNLAHGAFYLLGGYVALDLLHRGVNYFLALVIAMIVVGLLGVILERVFVHRLLGHELAQVVLTLGIAYVIGDQMLAIYGGRPQHPPRPPGLEGLMVLGDGRFPVFRLVLIGVAVIVYILIMLLIHRTTVGAKVRAAVDDEGIARSAGIPVPLFFMGVFGAGSALAAFAGVWGGAFTGIAPGTEFSILLLALIVVVLGGLGSVSGALLAALLVGLVDEFGKVLFPDLALFTVYAPVALLLSVRPQGLLGKAEATR
jgi:branched-chain amino acid transport system permease protein